LNKELLLKKDEVAEQHAVTPPPLALIRAKFWYKSDQTEFSCPTGEEKICSIA
jgi:hypothetical protein